MQISFPVQSVTKSAALNGMVQKKDQLAPQSPTSTEAQKVPVPYLNPKISVDAPSGVVLLQYRNEEGGVRLQIPSENAVKRYNSVGRDPMDPFGAIVVSQRQPESTIPSAATEAVSAAAPIPAVTANISAPAPARVTNAAATTPASAPEPAAPSQTESIAVTA